MSFARATCRPCHLALSRTPEGASISLSRETAAADASPSDLSSTSVYSLSLSLSLSRNRRLREWQISSLLRILHSFRTSRLKFSRRKKRNNRCTHAPPAAFARKGGGTVRSRLCVTTRRALVSSRCRNETDRQRIALVYNRGIFLTHFCRAGALIRRAASAGDTPETTRSNVNKDSKIRAQSSERHV